MAHGVADRLITLGYGSACRIVLSRVGGTAYAVVSNTTARKGLWVRIPHPAPNRAYVMRAVPHPALSA